jgi:transglutaminase-like putative cysteine protease
MQYRATHTTRYRYNGPVSQCHTEVRLTPRSLPWQSVVTRSIATVPEATTVDEWKDYFGNTVSMISILETHDRFSIEAVSRVRVEERPQPPPSYVAWEAARDQLAVHRSVDALEAFEFVFDSPFVAGSIELLDYAKPSFDSGRPLLAAAGELSHRIHAEFTYKPSSTNIETPLLEALRHKRGVCQDFSHVMIGALRSLGLAARYVSGYLRSGVDYQGAEASHAWVSVFVPGIGWVDFDPTNDVMPGMGHVTLAWGRDYGDVAPIKGIALGGGGQAVEVAVRVEPIDTAT